MAKFCRYCGSPLEEGDTFCGECGKPIGVKREEAPAGCPQCGAQLKGTEKFCKYCGYDLIAGRKSVSGSGRRSAQEEQKKQRRDGQAVRRQPKAAGTEALSYPTGNSGFYLFDFAKSLMKPGKIPSLIYLLLNVLIIVGVVGSGMPESPLAAVGIGLLIYLVSISIALSPIGEFLVRYQSGCRAITDPQVLQRMTPIFRRVESLTRQVNPGLPKQIRYYMNDDTCPNAFATGRKTVCITRGLLQMEDSHIEAILGHEFGHLSHHDTDMLLVIMVGNLFVNFFIFIGRTCLNLMLFISALFVETEAGALMHRFISFMCAISVNLMLWLWGQIGVLLTMKTSRSDEFAADHFSGMLGYGSALADALEALEGGSGGRPQGVFAALSSSHPPTQKRVEKLRAEF